MSTLSINIGMDVTEGANQRGAKKFNKVTENLRYNICLLKLKDLNDGKTCFPK